MGGNRVVNKKDCKTPQKTVFVRKRQLPSKLIPGTVYIIESDDNDEFVDLFVADNQGNKKTIIDSIRLQTGDSGGGGEDELSLIDYRSDIISITNYYYYGYEFEDNSFKIIRVQKGNVINQGEAINLIGTFSTNWDNRETLTYN